ncbi:hypothetical protein B0H63DRAFT_56788 [Podospora didyma]|uniref:Uncharacterized protein n=1 Tax=Podospora didyma TaxID=330526 RepID=A0AAE0U8D1_9PEZI|nr:hypothetical protein B0H63DRAFT_56788 [Podospora didyma]
MLLFFLVPATRLLAHTLLSFRHFTSRSHPKYPARRLSARLSKHHFEGNQLGRRYQANIWSTSLDSRQSKSWLAAMTPKLVNMNLGYSKAPGESSHFVPHTLHEACDAVEFDDLGFMFKL